MRAVIQRVTRAKVSIGNRIAAEIGRGLLIFVAVGADDTPDHARSLAGKIANLRVFDDANSRMNRSLLDVSGEALVVSEFTLYGNCRKGRRPNYVRAAPPEVARQLYLNLVESLSTLGVKLTTGEFREIMQVELINDGPVTLLLDTERGL